MPRFSISNIKTLVTSVNPSALPPDVAVELDNTCEMQEGKLTKRRGYVHTSVTSFAGVIDRLFAYSKRDGSRFMIISGSGRVDYHQGITTEASDGDKT